MSSPAIPVPFDCSNVCVPTGAASVPGPPGEQGPPGADGTNGVDAYSLSVSGTDLMPDLSGSVTIAVLPTSAWMAVGQILYVQFWGWMRVTAKPTALSVTLLNLEDGTGAYDENSPLNTVLPAGATISPGGLQGVTGTTDASLFLLKAQNLADLPNPATARSNLSLGTAALATKGVANGNVPSIDDVGGIAASEFAVGTGTALEGVTPANVRTLLSLEKGVANGDVPPVDQLAGLTVDQVLVATAAGLKSVTASVARGLLDVTAQDMLLYVQRQNSGDAGDFTSGGRNTVPLNTEVVDTGGNGSISGSTILLAAGTYRYQFGVVGYEVDGFQGYLWDNDGSAVINNTDGVASYGQVAQAPAGSPINLQATGQGRFTIVGSTHIQLCANCGTTNTGDGFGKDPGLGLGKVEYSWLLLFKE